MSVLAGDSKRGSTEGGSGRRALGKGLDSLLPRVIAAATPIPAESEAGRPLEIPLGDIDRSPYQTRMHFDEAKIDELAKSIAESGVIQPILVRPLPNGRYQLIAGERRWLASQKAGKATIPAVLKQVSDELSMEMTIIENLQRQDLNSIEQAKAYERLGREFGMTQEQMAVRLGIDRQAIGGHLRLLKLPQSIQDKVSTGELRYSHARLVAQLPTHEEMERAVARIFALSLSVRHTEKMVHDWTHPSWNGKSQKKETPPPPPVDPNVKDAQERLQRALGLRVRIEDKKGRGRVIIEYGRLEDFDAIMDLVKEV